MTLEEFKKHWFGPSDFITVRTSGSTGSPKEIRLLKSRMVESARRTNDFFNIDKSSRLHSCIGFEFIGGKMLAVRAWTAGAEISAERPSNTPLAGFGRTGHISLLSVVPSQLDHILSHRENLPSIDSILVGGSAIPPGMVDKILKSGLDVWESYGMTETCSHIALRRAGAESRFFPLPGIVISTDRRSCLNIRIGDEEFATNDIAEVDSDGGFMILGRADNVIVSGAKKIHPEQVEFQLSRELASSGYPFRSLAISSLPDPKWGEIAVLVIEPDDYAGYKVEYEADSRLGVPELLEKIRLSSALPHYMLPKEIMIAKIPLTLNGKRDRESLRRLIRTSKSSEAGTR